MKYDKEEHEILEAYESGRMKLSTPSKKEIEAIKAAAKNTFKKDVLPFASMIMTSREFKKKPCKWVFHIKR